MGGAGGRCGATGGPCGPAGVVRSGGRVCGPAAGVVRSGRRGRPSRRPRRHGPTTLGPAMQPTDRPQVRQDAAHPALAISLP